LLSAHVLHNLVAIPDYFLRTTQLTALWEGLPLIKEPRKNVIPETTSVGTKLSKPRAPMTSRVNRTPEPPASLSDDERVDFMLLRTLGLRDRVTLTRALAIGSRARAGKLTPEAAVDAMRKAGIQNTDIHAWVTGIVTRKPIINPQHLR